MQIIWTTLQQHKSNTRTVVYYYIKHNQKSKYIKKGFQVTVTG